jgi:hypothetical protein
MLKQQQLRLAAVTGIGRKRSYILLLQYSLSCTSRAGCPLSLCTIVSSSSRPRTPRDTTCSSRRPQLSTLLVSTFTPIRSSAWRVEIRSDGLNLLRPWITGRRGFKVCSLTLASHLSSTFDRESWPFPDEFSPDIYSMERNLLKVDSLCAAGN